MAARNTANRYSFDDIESLQYTSFKPIRVDGQLEAKAEKFWRANCYTSKSDWRDNAFTRNLSCREQNILDLYLNQKVGDCIQGHHYFVGLYDVTTAHLYTHFKGQRREVMPVYRVSIQTASGERHFDYVYGSWQSGRAIEIVG